MKNMGFVSRHIPTEGQFALAQDQGYNLIHLGDLDAFAPNLEKQIEVLDEEHKLDAVACVHPRIALKAHNLGLKVGMFNNVNRAPMGEKPDFHATMLLVE